MALIDWDTTLLPDDMTLPLMWLGLVAAAVQWTPVPLVTAFWGAVAGLLYVYYHKYIHPTSLSLTNSAEALLGVIAGGSGTPAGPIIGAAIVVILKNYASAYVERWNMLLGFVFVVIVIFMPDGLIPGFARLAARWKGGRK